MHPRSVAPAAAAVNRRIAAVDGALGASVVLDAEGAPGRMDPTSYTTPFSVSGWPAATVRAGTSAGGLPIGVQLAAPPWRDELALAAAMAVESALGGWSPPPLWLRTRPGARAGSR